MKQEHFSLANEIFANLGVQITVDGRRHLGAVLGTNSFAETYVRNKVQEPDCLQLHSAKCNLPICSFDSWPLQQMDVSNENCTTYIGHLFQPLDEAIRHNLISALSVNIFTIMDMNTYYR